MAATRRAQVFLSYSRDDAGLARHLEESMRDCGLRVWRDEVSINASDIWVASIEQGIRDSLGLVVLITTNSAASEWITYEYALAKGAQVPVVAVRVGEARIPKPLQHFQVEPFSNALSAAKRIRAAIRAQARKAGQVRAASPELVARFQEIDGELVFTSPGKDSSIAMDLWVEKAPKATKRVAFEILDLGVDGREWTVNRRGGNADSARPFLTDDIDLYGDVDIWARGDGPGKGNWTTSSRLYEALLRYYGNRRKSSDVRRALNQIRDN